MSVVSLRSRDMFGQNQQFHLQLLYWFTGVKCEVNIDDCLTSPCRNGTCIDLVNNYTCKCHVGFTGPNCDIIIRNCSDDSCYPNVTCYKNMETISCGPCPHGLTGDGKSCEDIDYCVNVTCKNGGSCVDGLDNYTCSCVKGFIGNHCETVTEISPTSDKILLPHQQVKSAETEEPETGHGIDDLEDKKITLTRSCLFSLKKKILKQYSQYGGFISVEILSFKPGSVVVEFKLTFKRKLGDEKALAPLKHSIKDGKMGSLSVDPESLEVKKYSEEPTDVQEDEKKIPYTLIIGISCGGAFILALVTICGIRYCQRQHQINRLHASDGMPADVVFSRAETYEMEDTKSKEDIVSYEEIGISNAAAMYGELGTSKDAVRYEKLDFSNDAYSLPSGRQAK
ncbi:hypothetical protein OS493_036559 [Desmophyllum pertusum]|uniref:EGF-like domain-containing protein n=1 Tax=Desmophyllum pertusum TaxID=174260 RepID=A0A9W9YLD7_9CNID|nr:hypothetical protein OS493_036559 [Desmophyllum pertusum]